MSVVYLIQRLEKEQNRRGLRTFKTVWKGEELPTLIAESLDNEQELKVHLLRMHGKGKYLITKCVGGFGGIKSLWSGVVKEDLI